MAVLRLPPRASSVGGATGSGALRGRPGPRLGVAGPPQGSAWSTRRMRPPKRTGDHATKGYRAILPPAGALLAALATVAPAVALDGWTRYADPRFGAAADVPPGFAAGEPPAESGGLELTGVDGRARIAIYGLPNVEGQRLEEYSAFSTEEETRAGWKATYNRVADSWFVHSGWKEGRSSTKRRFSPAGPGSSTRSGSSILPTSRRSSTRSSGVSAHRSVMRRRTSAVSLPGSRAARG